MNKNRIRLTESQLHRVIKESVRQMLSEVNWNDPKWQYSLGALAGRKHNSDVQNDDYSNEEGEIDDFAAKANGGHYSKDFLRGQSDFEDATSDYIRDTVNSDPMVKFEWDGDKDVDDYYDAYGDYSDDDWMRNEYGDKDFSLHGYDLKGAMKKRGLSESRLHNVIKESVKRVLSHPRRGY